MKKLSLQPTLKYSVDKLRISIDVNGMIKDGHISSNYTYQIFERFKSICNVESSNGIWKKADRIWKKEFHKFACWVKIPVKDNLQGKETSYAKVLIFIDPIEKPNKRYITFEYNPSKISTLELFKAIRLWIQIDKALLNSKVFKKHIRLRALDLAIDVNRNIETLTFFGSYKRYEETRYSSGLTRYLGARVSDNYFCIYDKRAELEQKRKKPHAPNDYLETAPAKHLTRIEVRKRLAGEPIKYLPKIASDLFNSLTVSNLRLPDENDTVLFLYWELARHIGANAAYTKVHNDNDKKRIRAYLKAHRTKWWNQGTIAQKITRILKDLVNQIE
jgi:hypothetical protein